MVMTMFICAVVIVLDLFLFGRPSVVRNIINMTSRVHVRMGIEIYQRLTHSITHSVKNEKRGNKRYARMPEKFSQVG
jgi:hypothetical protein